MFCAYQSVMHIRMFSFHGQEVGKDSSPMTMTMTRIMCMKKINELMNDFLFLMCGIMDRFVYKSFKEIKQYAIIYNCYHTFFPFTASKPSDGSLNLHKVFPTRW